MVRTRIHELVIAGEDEELTEFFEADPSNKKLINEPDAIGWTPLHWACSKGHNKEVKILLANKADPNMATDVDLDSGARRREEGQLRGAQGDPARWRQY